MKQLCRELTLNKKRFIMKIIYATICEIGKRQNNEDAFRIVKSKI